MRQTQKEMILAYLKMYGSITTIQAFADLGITKLTTRISELRKDGYDIQSESILVKNRFGKDIRFNSYSLTI